MDTLVIKVSEEGTLKVLTEEVPLKIMNYPEFIELIERNSQFEFLGRYNNFDLNQPLEETTDTYRPMTILRRK